MLLWLTKIIVIFVCVLVTASGAYCAPAVSLQNNVVNTSSSLNSISELSSSAVPTFNVLDNQFAGVASKLFKPPASVEKTPDAAVKSLPAVPAAICMVLSGFLCVTIIKDRRFWLACFAVLFSVGQMGITNIPRLAYSLGSNIKNCSAKELKQRYHLGEFFHIRSDIEGTKYIGLLHYLAGIPNAATPNPSTLFAVAFLNQHSQPTSSSRCMDYVVGHYIPFSHAFTFNIMPRSPPLC